MVDTRGTIDLECHGCLRAVLRGQSIFLASCRQQSLIFLIGLKILMVDFQFFVMQTWGRAF
ncbi:hypothetical protein CK623_09585 [Vandammella animalimorsus]|uniref:Uncharacterized protein n=1 Tax=Vandammella animalimorsus TaxID=2029117 RepID=A0A2A2APP5_9BURK|nr:hypothetical protein CK623_09585 [Vandammella animalimorsus]